MCLNLYKSAGLFKIIYVLNVSLVTLGVTKRYGLILVCGNKAHKVGREKCGGGGGEWM